MNTNCFIYVLCSYSIQPGAYSPFCFYDDFLFFQNFISTGTFNVQSDFRIQFPLFSIDMLVFLFMFVIKQQSMEEHESEYYGQRIAVYLWIQKRTNGNSWSHLKVSNRFRILFLVTYVRTVYFIYSETKRNQTSLSGICESINQLYMEATKVLIFLRVTGTTALVRTSNHRRRIQFDSGQKRAGHRS